MPLFQKKSTFLTLMFFLIFFSRNLSWAIPAAKPVAQIVKEIKAVIGLQKMADAPKQIANILKKYTQYVLYQNRFDVGFPEALKLYALSRRDVIPLEKATNDLANILKKRKHIKQLLETAKPTQTKKISQASRILQMQEYVAKIRLVRSEIEKYGFSQVENEIIGTMERVKDQIKKFQILSIDEVAINAKERLQILRDFKDIFTSQLTKQIEQAGGVKQAIEQLENLLAEQKAKLHYLRSGKFPANQDPRHFEKGVEETIQDLLRRKKLLESEATLLF